MSLEELKKALKKEKLIFGANQTIRNLKNGKTKVIFLANNCSEEIKKNIKYYVDLSKAKIIDLDKSKNELSVFCKKGYPISVISY
jgi:large subunit ribosomal protein L30e